MARTYTNAEVFDGGELLLDRVLALAVLEKLAEREERGTLEEHFGNDAACAEDVHGFCDGVVWGRVFFVCLVEALWGEVTRAPSAGVIEKGKVGWVVEGETGWLEGGKVSEVDPVRGSDEDVGGLNVAVGGVLLVGECEAGEELVDDPLLFDGSEKGTGAAGDE